MVTKKEISRREEQMFEFLRKGFSEDTEITIKYFEDKRITPRIPYLLVKKDEEKGLIIPVYAHKPHQDNKIKQFYNIALKQGFEASLLIYKDGKDFFRNAAEKNDFKRRYSLSLKYYTSEQTRKMINLSPEEIYVKNSKTWMQYYQPKSKRLEERIVSVKFKPVTFDYSHISSYERFKPHNKDSEMMFMWDNRVDGKKPLILNGGYIKSLKLETKKSVYA